MVRTGKSTDIFVIGGGPAGLAVALAARQRGLTVMVADGLAPPIDKACGEGLMPDGVAALHRLGVSVSTGEGHPFRGIRFVHAGIAAEADFPNGIAMGVRRTDLHPLMVERAAATGVDFLWRAVVTGIGREHVDVNHGTIYARWIVGADGGGSAVRRWAGLDLHRRKEQRYAFRRHYRIGPWAEFMELHWGPNCQLYVTPVGRSEVCVALISRDPALRLDGALRFFPEVAKRLDLAKHGSVERGAVSVTRRLARVYSGNVALVGDASGGVDAITGEGLCLAFQQADLLAQCIAEKDLRRYQRGHRALARRPMLMARLMLLLEHQGLRERAMRAFSKRPGLFANMLAMHVGAASTAQATAGGLALGWGLLTA